MTGSLTATSSVAAISSVERVSIELRLPIELDPGRGVDEDHLEVPSRAREADVTGTASIAG